MGKARGIGEGKLSSLREQRNLREKDRRMRMKHLFSILSSYVSPTHKLPVPQLIDQATAYMIKLKGKVDYMKEKKRTLLQLGELGNAYQASFLQPKLSIRSRHSTIEMNLIVDLNMKRVMLHELMSVFEEEGAQVMSANLQNLNDKTTYTIIAQAMISRIGIDPSSIEERVRTIIYGYIMF
ncbi:hypothetical protein CARUB_v10010416mg [Capsella rubella]|uniref:BHLH domain-containing protein n=1 Tax=Capsella rubella TaxID=81985 RepID=R0IJL1_9BRAS|nr:transcription factor bHLH167 [Capsella rubella]EOA37133.1 hypothetical protein CARUB_v10010416mg [Capsella rubella]